ncbi:MAG: CPBP family intramembrane metalloprotease [Lachnospiraceae bacterium]|nr:CPBP family intramembrane metalloprotease [Lachnospiraceae bacterium]
MNNNHYFNKIWDVFKPFIIYYVLYSVVFILIISLCRTIAQGLGDEYMVYLTEHAETVTGLVSGLSMMISVLPLIPMLRHELAEHKFSVSDTVYDGSSAAKKQNGAKSGKNGIAVTQAALTILLAASSSLGLNVLLALTGLVESSAGYQDVARQQYSVVFGAGMILFGLISPITEEIVFRGLVFNRMRRYFPHVAAVAASGVLFGIYHGNLVQGLYGGCMGMLMAYLYERMHSFLIPCLFHAAANLVVYVVAQNMALQGKLFTLTGCVALLGVSAICIVIVELGKPNH